jgi:hypothetical protein
MTPRSNPPRQTPHRAQDVDPSTSQRGTSASARLANIPEQAIEKATGTLRRYISPEHDDEDIIAVVWAIVRTAFLCDPKMKNRLASNEEFCENVKRKGQNNFLESLRAMAANSDTQGLKAWEDLFEDGMHRFLLGSIIYIVFSLQRYFL